MNIRDVFDRILLRSGQYILKRSNIDIDVDTFRILVEDALSDYSRAVPYEAEYTLDFNSTSNLTFNPTYDPIISRAPDWISEATPIASYGSMSTIFGSRNNSNTYGEVIDPIEAPWIFNDRTKVLTTPFRAFYKVTACFKHIVVASTANSGETEYSVPTITVDDQLFFRLLQGMFLQGIGRSRRAFTLSDLPIVMDADQLVSDGSEMEEQAREKLNNVQKFHLAFG